MMAVYGVLGDIHGNLEGLGSALRALQDRGVQQLLCIGDIIGYNADSNECVAIMRNLDARIIAGNHDLIGTGLLGFDRCSNKARYSLQRTRRQLDRDSVAWLRALPRALLIDAEIALVHGGVRDVQLYMTAAAHIRKNTEYLREDFPAATICFFGHSHEQRVYEVDGDKVESLPLHPGVAVQLSWDRTYFINPGSVDAQRKRDYGLAECAILDTTRWTIEFLRTSYDDRSTEAKAVDGGYRIGPLADKWFTLRRRLIAKWRKVRPGAGGS